MSREQRLVFLLILTLCLYAFSSLINQGAFIFPFPLNELLFLIIGIQFFIWNFKINPTLSSVLLIAGVMGVISSIHYWSFFTSDQNIEEIYKTITPDLLKIIYGLAILVCLHVFVWNLVSVRNISFVFAAVTAYVLGYFIGIPWLTLLSALIIFYFLLRNKRSFALSFPWLTLAILEFTREFTILFNS